MENHPESLEKLNEVKITEDVKEFITGLASEVQEAKNGRTYWDQRQDDYYRKRYGLRQKRNFPWPGYPNFILPLIDSDIQKAKPAYVNATFGVSPIVTYEPFGPRFIEAGRMRENLMDFRIKHKMNFFEPYCIGVDKMLQQGFVVFKIIWDFKSRKYTEVLNLAELPDQVINALYDPITTDIMLKKVVQEEFDIDMDFEENDEELDRIVKAFREGETDFTLHLLEKERNEAAVIVCDPQNDIVVPTDTTDIADARWLDYKFYLSVNDIKIAMRDGKYNEFSDDEILAWAGKGTYEKSTDREFREGIQKNGHVPDELVLLHETCVLYDIDGDGILEKCIATWPDNAPSEILRFIELPYDHGMWPYAQVERELVDSGFYSSRGIPALDDDFQTGISASFNNDLANQLIVNTPYVKYVKGAVVNIRNRRFIPGEAVELRDMNGYTIEQSVNASQGTFMVTQQQLKAWAQERIGNQSSGLTSPTNPVGNGQQGKKTAREIEEISFISSQSQSLDIMVHQMQMKKVYFQIDALYYQFGAEEEFIMTGDQPAKVTRRQIQGKFNLVPTGKLENSNPVMRAQKSFMTMSAFKGDPNIKQDELYKLYLMDVYDPKIAKRLLFTPEEKAQIAQQQAMMQQQGKVSSMKDSIDVKRIGNMLELEREAGLATIHGRRFAPDNEEGQNGKDGSTEKKGVVSGKNRKSGSASRGAK